MHDAGAVPHATRPRHPRPRPRSADDLPAAELARLRAEIAAEVLEGVAEAARKGRVRETRENR